MPIKDLKKRKEYMREYSRKHYQLNKSKYNPARTKRREKRRVALQKYYSILEPMVEEITNNSSDRWVGPTEILRLCRKRIPKNCEKTANDLFDAVIREFNMQGEAGVGDVGLFLGKATFSKWFQKQQFEYFKKRCPKRVTDNNKAELLILKLTLKHVYDPYRYS